MDIDIAVVERGRLEVEPDIVGELDEVGVSILDIGFAHHLPWEAEIGERKSGDIVFGERLRLDVPRTG